MPGCVVGSVVRLVTADAAEVLPTSAVSWRRLATEHTAVDRRTAVVQLQVIP